MAAFVAAAGPLLARGPRGDGHRVLVLPGFTADDRSTRPMRWFLRRLGYRPSGWRLGRNLGPTQRVLQGMAERFDALSADGAPISLVGWSLGGIYARELARLRPHQVRLVITMGSPFRLDLGGASNARGLYELIGAVQGDRVRIDRSQLTDRGPLPVPSTAIYTRTDGVVPWRSSMEPDGPQCESIEVRGSHSGLGHNPKVLQIVADRLAQPLGGWTPYRDRRGRT